MGQTGAAVKRQGVVAALADLLAQLDSQRAEADALVSKIAELVSRRDALQAEIAKLRKARNTTSLGSLDDANAARAVEKANAMDALLTFHRDHPHASLRSRQSHWTEQGNGRKLSQGAGRGRQGPPKRQRLADGLTLGAVSNGQTFYRKTATAIANYLRQELNVVRVYTIASRRRPPGHACWH